MTERPPFEAPWEARVFAIAVHLNERGLFGWSEFATALGARLPEIEDSAGTDFYRCWHAALTDVLAAAGVDI